MYATLDDEGADADAEAEFVARQVAASEELVAHGHGEWLGAFDHGLLVAALGIVSDGSGAVRYQAVETHPEYRRRGLAAGWSTTPRGSSPWGRSPTRAALRDRRRAISDG